jgi:phage terminase large subunit
MKRCTVWRDTKTDCKKTVFADTVKHFKQTNRFEKGFTLNKTESIFTYKTNSTFEIHGTDDEITVHGLTQQVAWLNEPYKISRETFNQIDQRTEDFILIDINPKMNHWSDDLSKDPRCIVIHSTFADNPLCPEESRKKIQSYQPVKMCQLVLQKKMLLKEAIEYDIKTNRLQFSSELLEELQRCRDNEYKKSANEFNWSVYGLGLKGERPNRIFHWEKIPDEVYHQLEVPIYTGVDWGIVDPWGILDVKYYDGALYLHERNYKSENEWREQLNSTELTQVKSAEEGLVKWIFNKLQIPFNRYIICDNNRVLKILALREAGWEYSVAAEKARGSVIDGITLLTDLRVYYTASSTNIDYEQENYSRKEDNYGVVLEEPEDLNNHLIDPARYVALYLFNQGIIKKN